MVERGIALGANNRIASKSNNKMSSMIFYDRAGHFG